MPITKAQAQEVTRAFVRDYPGALELAYRLREDAAALYGPRAGEVPQGMKGGYVPIATMHAGRTYRGRVDVALANMDDARDLLLTLRHEVLGHYGANTLAPLEKRALLDALAAARDEPSLKPLWDDIDRRYAAHTLDVRAEEVFALCCEGIEPRDHQQTALPAQGIDQVRQQGQQSFTQTCIARARTMQAGDLHNIVCAVAQGLRERSRTQQTFAQINELFRRDDQMEPKKPFHETVAEKLIEQLRQGTAPWQKPWEPGESAAFFPMNPTTGNRYKGINAIYLMAQGHDDQRWMTYKQASAAGAQVRKGERGTPIQYWKFQDETPKTDAQGKPVLDASGEQVMQRVKLERPKVFHATVFNAGQIDGLPPMQRKEPQDQGWTAVERAQAILDASGATIKHAAQNRAFYRLATDSIHLPEQSQFPTADNYYATALHELGHWTGHETRLARDLSHPFGSEGYAKEELRAEIASMILGDELGIGHDPGQHAAYVKCWITVLENDPLEIFRAAADAEKIHAFVLGLEHQRQQDQAAMLEPQQQTPETPMHQPQQEAVNAARLAEDWTLRHIEHGTLAGALEGANSNHLARVQDVLAAMVPLNTQNQFWVRNTLSNDVDTLESKIKTATTLIELHRSGLAVPADAVKRNLTVRAGMVAHTLRDAIDKTIDDALAQAALYRIEATRLRATAKAQDALPDAARVNREAAEILDAWAQTRTLQSDQAHDVAAKSGIPMESMPGKRMVYNDRPGMSGAEIVNEDGSRLSFGDQESIQRYAAANNLALAEVRTLMEFNARANQQRALPEQLRFINQYESTEGAPGRLHDRLADTVMPYNDAFLADTWRDLQVSTDATREGDALAFRDQSRRAFGFELPTDWNGRVQVQANVMDGDAVVRADSDAGQAPEFYGVYAQHGDGMYRQLQDLPTLDAAEALAHRIGMVDAHAEINGIDQAAKLARLKEEAVRRDPTATDGQRDAAKEERKNASAIAAVPSLIARLALARGDTDGHGAKTFIDVPFKQKAKAKALGAKWDRQAQSWFIPSTVDPAPFVRWAKDTPEPVPVPRNTQADTQAAGAQSAPQGRQYLAVPYAERVAAKAFGAEWDKVVKSWYVGPQADAAQLQRWAPENVRSEQEPAMHPRDEFAQAMREHGLVVAGDHPIMDGNKHRVPVEGGKKGAVDGFYVLYPDGHPAGRIINHKTGADETWKSKGYSLSAQEKAVLHAQAAENLARRAATLAAQHEQAAARVSRQLDTLQPVEQPTPYLAAKGVQAHPGAFTDSEQKTTFIPAIDADNKMWSMQYIQEDGTKRFAKDGRKEGCFHAIGGLDALASAPAIVIGEGYATAATLCEALGFSTVAAFDSGNLPAVARALQAKFPAKPIVIAGDDDHHREITEGKNPGREKMEEAAKAVGAAKMLPIFAPGEREAHPNVFTDFNDLATKSALGRGGVERQVRAAVEAAIDKRSAVFEPQEERRLVQTNEHRQGRRPTNTEPVRRKRAARG